MFRSKTIITGNFLEYNIGYWPNSSGYHTGVDLVPDGTDPDIIVPFECTVLDIHNANDQGLGLNVSLWLPEYRIVLRLAHLRAINVVKGMKLSKGHKVGVMGGTNGTEKPFSPHIHCDGFVVNENGNRAGCFKSATWSNARGYTDPTPLLRLLGVDFK